MTMVEAYFHLIVRGERKITDVPASYRTEVIKMLEKYGYKELSM